MHLTFSGFFSAPFTSPPKHEVDNADHTYIRGDVTERAPCPGLNALANQGYLPRDGKNLTIPMVHHALHVAFHMSDAAASALTHTIKPFLRKDGTFDLIDLRKHGVMEHDASLTRLDFHQGDNYTFQPQMLENMIQDANGGDVTLRSLAKSFNRRCRESRAAGAPRMGLKLWFVTVFQLAGLINVAQTGGKLSRRMMESIFAEEKLPDVILTNPQPRTIFTLLKNATGMLYWCIFGPVVGSMGLYYGVRIARLLRTIYEIQDPKTPEVVEF